MPKSSQKAIMMNRRQLSLALLGAIALTTRVRAASAAEDAAAYPGQSIRFIVPFAPGGTTDYVVRSVQPKMQELLGQPVVIENRPGAAGNLAMEIAAKTAPDGYTILLGDVGSITINAAVYPDLKVKPLTDFVPISIITYTPSLLVVGPTFPPQTIQELVDYVKARPGQVSFASQGAGSQNRLAMEVFAQMAGLNMIHVPYKGGSGPAAADIMGGHIPMMFAGLPPVIGLVRAGSLRVLGVATRTRHPSLPDVPTFVEAGYPDMVMSSWQGVFVPAATPHPIIAKLHAVLVEVMADPAVKARLAVGGLDPDSPTPEESLKFIAAEADRWTAIAKAVGATAD
jgi:tripartite-type tricarboxylate transporter receptor subunit TctC